MKKVFRLLSGILAAVLLVLLIVVFMNENDRAIVESYVGNQNLPTIRADWKGTPVDEKGRFVNYEFPFLSKFTNLLKWQLSSNPQKEEKENDKDRLAVLDPAEFLQSEKDGILWLGHASFYIRLNGKSLLLDPIFGKPSFVKTYVDVPSPLEKIRQLDYVLLSHDHRDHCDEESIKQIAAKFPDAKFCAGLRMEEVLKDWVTPTNEIQTAGWFQQFNLPDEQLKLYFLPARHWCRRGLFDMNHDLWGSFIIQGAEKTIYFSGDSGYGSHYAQTAELFPDIDYFLIGIGAYKPRWFMEPNHNSPDDALKAFADSRAKILVPMHFGRFDLSDEPLSEPLKVLREKAAEMNLSDKIKFLNINQSIVFENTGER